MISGILGFIKSIYYAVANVGTVLEILFRYLGRVFDLISLCVEGFLGGRVIYLGVDKL